MSDNTTKQYHYYHGELGSQHAYLLPAIEKIIERLKPNSVFELGCGNGSVAAWLHDRNIKVSAIDASESGIQQARAAYPDISFKVRSAYDDLASEFGQFPMLLSLEVIEHLYSPRIFAANVYQLLQPGAYAVISTPYHGYWKNLAIALSGKSDHHFSALWDGGHIKFWSMNTLSELLLEAGFVDIEFRRVGRIPVLAKSMIAIARKPAGANA